MFRFSFSFKDLLPKEHGAWVVMSIGSGAGLALGPGLWQLPVLLGWLGLFFVRVPMTKILDERGSNAARTLTLIASFAIVSGFAATFFARPSAVYWAASIVGPGVVLVTLRSRRFMRGLAGEILSVLAMAPLIASLAAAGDAPPAFEKGLALTVWMGVYLVASVFRVRALSRLGRHRASLPEMLAGLLFFPACLAAAWLFDFWGKGTLLGALPTIALGSAMLLLSMRIRIPLMKAGLLETVMLLAFASGLVWDFRQG